MGTHLRTILDAMVRSEFGVRGLINSITGDSCLRHINQHADGYLILDHRYSKLSNPWVCVRNYLQNVIADLRTDCGEIFKKWIGAQCTRKKQPLITENSEQFEVCFSRLSWSFVMKRFTLIPAAYILATMPVYNPTKLSRASWVEVLKVVVG